MNNTHQYRKDRLARVQRNITRALTILNELKFPPESVIWTQDNRCEYLVKTLKHAHDLAERMTDIEAKYERSDNANQ